VDKLISYETKLEQGVTLARAERSDILRIVVTSVSDCEPSLGMYDYGHGSLLPVYTIEIRCNGAPYSLRLSGTLDGDYLNSLLKLKAVVKYGT